MLKSWIVIACCKLSGAVGKEEALPLSVANIGHSSVADSSSTVQCGAYQTKLFWPAETTFYIGLILFASDLLSKDSETILNWHGNCLARIQTCDGLSYSKSLWTVSWGKHCDRSGRDIQWKGWSGRRGGRWWAAICSSRRQPGSARINRHPFSCRMHHCRARSSAQPGKRGLGFCFCPPTRSWEVGQQDSPAESWSWLCWSVVPSKILWHNCTGKLQLNLFFSSQKNFQACSPSADDCLPANSASKLCSISIDIFNMHPPIFNRPFGLGNIDLSSCSGGSNCNLPVVLEKQITANDGDGEHFWYNFIHIVYLG